MLVGIFKPDVQGMLFIQISAQMHLGIYAISDDIDSKTNCKLISYVKTVKPLSFQKVTELYVQLWKGLLPSQTGTVTQCSSKTQPAGDCSPAVIFRFLQSDYGAAMTR